MLTVIVGLDASGKSRTLQAVGEPVLGDALDRRDLLRVRRRAGRGADARAWRPEREEPAGPSAPAPVPAPTTAGRAVR